ncbi:MAG: hypothetical protein ABI054_02010 [Planctomycetota bacterium]
MRGLTSLPLSLALLSLASPASAQSLSRTTLRPGGVETFEEPAVIDISPDGLLLVSTSFDGLVAGDANGFTDLVITDRRTGVNSLALIGVGGAPLDENSIDARFSFNNRYLCITTFAGNLGAVDTNLNTDVYVKDLVTGSVVRGTLGVGGVEPDLGADTGSISDDGRWLAFVSYSNNVMPNIGAPHYEIYVRDLWTGALELISTDLNGLAGEDVSGMPTISADARYVAFLSQSPRLVAGDTNHYQDVFVRDRRTHTTTRVNLGPGGAQSNGEVFHDLRTSSDGRVLAFDSNATNLIQPGGTPNFLEIYVIDRASQQITLASAGPGGIASDSDSFGPRISADGRYVSLQSWASNLCPADVSAFPDLFRFDRQTGALDLVSRATNGTQGTVSPVFGFSMGFAPLSGDGQLAAFTSNLEGLVAGDSNQHDDVFLWDSASQVAPIESYCTAKLNSLGCTPVITSAGQPRAAGATDAFFLSASNVRSHSAGLLVWSLQGQAAIPFAGGILCIAPPIHRSPIPSSGGSFPVIDCSGAQSFRVSQSWMATHAITPGTLVCAQFWSRDPGFAAPNNVGMSDAIRFTAAP